MQKSTAFITLNPKTRKREREAGEKRDWENEKQIEKYGERMTSSK